MIVGVGSGSTAALAVAAIGKGVAGGLRMVGVATSENTAQQARELGIQLSTLADHDHIDITIDGADEVDLGTFNLIKGRGGALLREKIVASASEQLFIIVDETQLVERLGAHDPVPLEVVPFGYQATAQNGGRLGSNADLRLNADGKPYLTDGGHY